MAKKNKHSMTPEQETAFHDTAEALVVLEGEIGAEGEVVAEKKKAYDAAKKKAEGLRAEKAQLIKRLIDIKAGRWQEAMNFERGEGEGDG